MRGVGWFVDYHIIFSLLNKKKLHAIIAVKFPEL